MNREFLIDRLIAERGTLDADTLRLWQGSDGYEITSPELAQILGLSVRTVQCWRRETGPRPRHLHARLIEAEIVLRAQQRHEGGG